jgi:tRNA 2-thiouridine synthesizing protein A
MNDIEVIKEDVLLDCTDLLCPMPIVKTTKAIKEMQSGQVLKMIATDAGSPPDIAAWSRQTGNELLLSTTEGEKFVFFLKKS